MKINLTSLGDALPLLRMDISSCMQNDRAIPVKMKEATMKWQSLIEKKDKGHNLGPPLLPAWEALLASLL
eukprot:7663574-Heterocapsa_arctica.AAC.1